MKVVVSCFAPTEPFGLLTEGIPVAMLPVLNKPIIEHLLERCVEAGLSTIHVAVTEHPRPARLFLGGGERWGVEIETTSMKDSCTDQQLLSRIVGDQGGPCLLIPAETLTDLDLRTLLEFHEQSGNQVTRVVAARDSGFQEDCRPGKAMGQTCSTAKSVDTGIVVASPPFDHQDSVGEFNFFGDWIRVQDPAQLWEANQEAVSGSFPQLRRPATSAKDGNWFGHHCTIHSLATIGTPVFVGNHVRIGPHAEILKGSVLGNGVIIDANATVKSSVVMDHTYVGAYTNVEERIVSGRFVMNVRTGSSIEVSDPIIVSGVREKTLGPGIRRLVERLIAAFLLVLTCPVWMAKGLSRIASGMPFFHRKSFLSFHTQKTMTIATEPTAVTLRTFDKAGPFSSRLPGLLDVMTGRLALVGTRPLAERERTRLTEDWTDLRDSAPEGLFTPVDAEPLTDPTDDEKVVIENYYVATRSASGDFRILVKAIFNLMFAR